MANYRDWMLIENPNELDEKELRKAIRSMGSVANKRLKRMEGRGINFGESTEEGTTAGVKRFGVAGKNLQELKNEFKRVRNFLQDPQSSLSGMARALREFKQKLKEMRKEANKSKKLNKRERKEYGKMQKQKDASEPPEKKWLNRWEELRAWRDVWKYYNRLVSEGYYAPSEYDSKQTRDIVYSTVYEQYTEILSDEKTFERIKEKIAGDYEERKSEDIDSEPDDISTSSLINQGDYHYGNSD